MVKLLGYESTVLFVLVRKCVCERRYVRMYVMCVCMYKACPSESGTDKFMQRFI
jgi:hypothetical protein